MNLRSISARAALVGATTALVAGGLVAATGTSANAVDNNTDYTCALTSPLQMDLGTFNMAISTPVIPPEATAGQSFPGGLLALTATLTIPAPTGASLANFGVDHADASDYAVTLGSSTIGAPIAFEEPTVNEDGSAVVPGAGVNKPFSLPPAGTYKAMLPKEFTLQTEITTTPGGDPTPATIGCTTATPGDLGSVKVTKGISSLKAKAAKKHKVNVTVVRLGDDVTPTGKVVAKVGKKKFTEKLDKKGKAVFTFPKSLKGKKAVFSYKGDGFTAGDSKDDAGKPISAVIK
jgi:hypothetical protein